MELWEILVPTMRNDGKPFRTRFHKVWDEKVRKVSGGLTIHTPAKGQWVHPENGELFKERMIPVRIMCTREQIDKIIDITLEYYDQIAVMAYRVSDEIILKHRTAKKAKGMSKQRELGVFEALAIVLVIMGLIALAANALGFLPKF